MRGSWRGRRGGPGERFGRGTCALAGARDAMFRGRPLALIGTCT